MIESVKYEYFKTAPKDLALHLALREGQMRPWVYKASQIAGEVHIAVSIVFGNRQKAEQAQKNIDDLMRVPTAESPNAAFKKVFGQGDQTNITVETLKDPVHDGNVSTLKTDNAPYYVQYDFDTRAGITNGRNKFKYLQCAAPIWENVDNLGKWLENEPNNEGISRPSDPFMEKPKPTPLEDLNGIVLRLSVTKWTTAEEAIRTTQKKYNIHKTMVSGYGMLTAGLTIQTSPFARPRVDEPHAVGSKGWDRRHPLGSEVHGHVGHRPPDRLTRNTRSSVAALSTRGTTSFPTGGRSTSSVHAPPTPWSSSTRASS